MNIRRISKLVAQVAVVSSVCVGLVSVGCEDELIKPSVPAAGTKASMNVSLFVPGAEGTVTSEAVSADANVYATRNTVVMFSGSASHPLDGVSDFRIEILDGPTTLFLADAHGSAIANGNVPSILRILGTDGSGGAGASAMTVTVSRPIQLRASATTFAGTVSTMTVTIQPLSPLNLSISLDPPQTEPGLPATLTWNAQNATVSDILPGVPGTNVVSGTVTVRRDQTQVYTLRAQQPFAGPKAFFPGFGTFDVSQQKTATLTITSQTPPTTTLQGVYRFAAYSGDASIPQTAYLSLKGTTAATGASGLTTIDQQFGPISYRLDGGTYQIPFSVPNVRPGIWTLTSVAYNQFGINSRITNPFSCSQTLPALAVTIDMTTSSPSCH